MKIEKSPTYQVNPDVQNKIEELYWFVLAMKWFWEPKIRNDSVAVPGNLLFEAVNNAELSVPSKWGSSCVFHVIWTTEEKWKIVLVWMHYA